MELSITLILVILTGLVSLSAFSNERMIDQLIFYPPAIGRGQWYRFFSCGLIHADAGHLIFNMLALYLFGQGSRIEGGGMIAYTGVEFRFQAIFGETGKYLYLLMYVLALGASLLPSYARNRHNHHYRSLGASGAVSAVVFAGILFAPLTGIGLFFVPVYIAGFLFGILYLLISHWLDRKGGGSINHSAHLYGALFGLAFTAVACQFLSGYPLLDTFIEQVRSARPGDWIQLGR